MVTILFTWELGGSLGHVTQIAPLVKGLQSAGHHVTVALREPRRAAGLFDQSDTTLLQSPFKPPTANPPIATPRTFAHVLWNAGFGDPNELQVLTEAWEKLLNSVAPDMIVFDHAPTALLAARGRKVKRVVLGNGFCCPPDCSPLPDLRSWMPPMPEQLQQTEQQVLDCMNQVLERRHAAPLERITQLYSQVDDTFLTTQAEFDHYPDRTGARYRGPWPLSGGGTPIWPAGSGKRIYAYLSPFPGLPKVLHALQAAGYPTIVSMGAADTNMLTRFNAPNLRFEQQPLDLKRLASECDLAVLNGNHGTTIAMLLAGKPVLHAPIFLEQGINAVATVRMGAGMIAFPRGVDRTGEQIAELLNAPKYTEAARQFAAMYANFSPEAEIAQAVQRLNALAASASESEFKTHC